MTDYLHITFKPEIDLENLEKDLTEFIKTRCLDVLPPEILQHFCVTKYTTNDYVTIDPYISSIPFRRLYEDKKKNIYIVILMEYIINFVKRYSSNISILFYFADKKKSDLRKETIYDFHTFLTTKKLPFNCEIIISSLLNIFYISEVEVSLNLNSKTNLPKEFIGYIRNYYIAAKNINKAVEYLIEDIQNESSNFIKYERIVEYEYWMLPDFLKNTLDPPNIEGVFYKSGRVYFSQE